MVDRIESLLKVYCKNIAGDIKFFANIEDVRDKPDALTNIPTFYICCLVRRDNGWKDRKKAEEFFS